MSLCQLSMWLRLQSNMVPLGRAFAEPEFKTVEKYYKKPRLRFFDINMGRIRAGELLAAFELIELDYSGFGEVMQVYIFKQFASKKCHINCYSTL